MEPMVIAVLWATLILNWFKVLAIFFSRKFLEGMAKWQNLLVSDNKLLLFLIIIMSECNYSILKVLVVSFQEEESTFCLFILCLVISLISEWHFWLLWYELTYVTLYLIFIISCSVRKALQYTVYYMSLFVNNKIAGSGVRAPLTSSLHECFRHFPLHEFFWVPRWLLRFHVRVHQICRWDDV